MTEPQRLLGVPIVVHPQPVGEATVVTVARWDRTSSMEIVRVADGRFVAVLKEKKDDTGG